MTPIFCDRCGQDTSKKYVAMTLTSYALDMQGKYNQAERSFRFEVCPSCTGEPLKQFLESLHRPHEAVLVAKERV